MKATPQRNTRAIPILVRLCLLAAISITGELILRHLELHPAEPTNIRIGRIVGGATASFALGLIPVVLIRNWNGFLLGVLIICAMDYFGAQAILSNQAVH